jgi:hypothetical protein
MATGGAYFAVTYLENNRAGITVYGFDPEV